MREMLVMAGALLLAGCGGGGGDAPAKDEVAAKLGIGLYELTGEVKSVVSTDKTSPATKLKLGDKVAARACVGAGGAPEPALFAEVAADKCEPQSSYIRNGRMSMQLSCKRAGDNGNVLVMVDGKFTADGFDAAVESITQFYSEGDYRLTRKVSGKRVGDCPAGGAKADA